MFSLFIVLLSFSESLACDRTKCLFLNDAPCMDLLLLKSILLSLNIIHSLLVSINVLEVIMSYLQKMCSKRNKRHKC